MTLEANPKASRPSRFTGYRTAGVNRVSLGVQSLDDASLSSLGRCIRARGARRSRDRATHFPSLFLRSHLCAPGTDPRSLANRLESAITEAAEHLSLYQLTIEPDTPFEGLHAAGKLAIPDADLARALYDVPRKFAARPACQPMKFPITRSGRGVPAQPRLLALSRICRHRPGGSRSARRRRTPPRHGNGEAAGGLARPRRA